MKIVHYFKSNIMAGAERVVYDIVSVLKKNKNYEVTVVCGGNRVKEHFVELGVETYVHVNRNVLVIKRKFSSTLNIKKNNLAKENMEAGIRIKLRQFFRNDIEKLEDMIKIDLLQWKGN